MSRRISPAAQLLVDLRPAAVDDHDAHAHGMQQAQVLDQRVDAAAEDHLAGDADDEGLAAKGVDIGCNPAQPGDELVVGQRRRSDGRRHRRVLRAIGHRGWRGVRIIHVPIIIILS